LRSLVPSDRINDLFASVPPSDNRVSSTPEADWSIASAPSDLWLLLVRGGWDGFRDINRGGPVIGGSGNAQSVVIFVREDIFSNRV
jgi:hypothetical protein